MNRRIIGLTPFTPATAPRNGRPKGARNKASARAWKVIDSFLADFAKHGDAAIASLRIDRPADYARMVIASAEVILRREVPENPVIVVSWLGDDDHDPSPKLKHLEHERLPPPPPARGPTITANENTDDSPPAREDRPSAELKPPGGWGGVA
jgi:hypothetical protein